jgi:hypothetical protein
MTSPDNLGSNETPIVNAKRRTLMIALGAGLASPLFGCGGRVSPSTSSASASSPPSAQLDTIPSVAFDDVAAPGLTTNYAYLSGSSKTNPVFTFYGAASSTVTQLGPTFPRVSMVSAANSNSVTLSPGAIYATFYHTGAALDLIQYGLSDSVTLYINDAFSARFGGALVSGIAQSGSVNGITLAASSSVVSGFYNEYYVRIAGGTGVLNEARQVTSYDGATSVATVASPWTTPPDSSTEYVIQDGDHPFTLDASTGSIKFIHLTWKDAGRRKITVEQGIFAGVASDGMIEAAPPLLTRPLLVVGDSLWEGVAAPIDIPKLIDTFAMNMRWQPTNLSQGGTGFINRYQVGNRLNFQDRIAPPAAAWRVLQTGTGGAFKISVTFGGVTNTSSAIAYNTSRTTLESALNALPNVAAVAGYFYVARGDFATPLIFIGHGIPGATISVDGSSLTGGTISVLGTYEGDVAANLPTDASGNPVPFYLLVPGSGNDTSLHDAQVEAAATYVAQQIVARFPTAVTIFTGVFGDCGAADSLIGPADISRNAAISAAAAFLPTIGGKVPFIDTYENGLGGTKIIYGFGTVADPQPSTNSNLKSITVPGHPTGPGSQFLADWLATRVETLTG